MCRTDDSCRTNTNKHRPDKLSLLPLTRTSACGGLLRPKKPRIGQSLRALGGRLGGRGMLLAPQRSVSHGGLFTRLLARRTCVNTQRSSDLAACGDLYRRPPYQIPGTDAW
ncbi:hypothetical protein Bbelb_157260 [Branchiostoma belcheri]|nr:hypothetical protein Bbelb_157260 [Branchiostoma belcheri]